MITDAWQGYSDIEDLSYVRERRSQRAARLRGEDPADGLRRRLAATGWAGQPIC
jgi:hypothetical protein